MQVSSSLESERVRAGPNLDLTLLILQSQPPTKEPKVGQKETQTWIQKSSDRVQEVFSSPSDCSWCKDLTLPDLCAIF